ncbi:MAG: Gfo/Idh/MocA family oxidoreductase [Candidatus Caldarchaeum sp.]
MKQVIGVAIIGAGYWGPNLIRTFMSLPDCQLRWVCDKKPGRLQYVHEKWPNIPLTDDYRTVLSDPRVDAVVIATPISTHYPLATEALEMGKHVLVEKPLATTSAEAQSLVEQAERLRRIIATGHIFVYHPAVVAMKTLIQQNAIGDLCYVESSRVNLGPPASERNVVWDLAVHDISIVFYLWGREPLEVIAYGRRFRHPRLTDVAFLSLHFADGSFTQHHVSWLCPEKVRRFFVVGTRGSLLFDDTLPHGKLRFIDQGIDSRIDLKDEEAKELYYQPGQVIVPELPPEEPLHVECQHFLDCIRTGQRPRADGYAGLAVVRILEAAEESIATGAQPIRLSGVFSKKKYSPNA